MNVLILQDELDRNNFVICLRRRNLLGRSLCWNDFLLRLLKILPIQWVETQNDYQQSKY